MILSLQRCGKCMWYLIIHILTTMIYMKRQRSFNKRKKEKNIIEDQELNNVNSATNPITFQLFLSLGGLPSRTYLLIQDEFL